MPRNFLGSMAGCLFLAASLTACNTADQQNAAQMTDDQLDQAVETQIRNDAALASFDIDVDADADAHAVTLTGAVPTEDLRDRVVGAARSAAPGTTVTDKIEVKPGDVDMDVDREHYTDVMGRQTRQRAEQAGDSIGASLEDAWLYTKVHGKLMTGADLPNSDINVDVKDDVVTLRGTVATTADRTEAEQAAKSIDGVTSVRNQLVVKPAR